MVHLDLKQLRRWVKPLRLLARSFTMLIRANQFANLSPDELSPQPVGGSLTRFDYGPRR
jgi:hypothetical protein